MQGERGQSRQEKVFEVDVSRFPIPAEVADRRWGFALFSDGACRGNPGPGSWGIMAQNSIGEVIFEASGMEAETTNNRMELVGAIEALKRFQDYAVRFDLPEEEVSVRLFSDSKYVVDGISKWVLGWKRRGWRKADKKIPENLDLWRELDGVVAIFYDIRFLWVRGHDGHPQNERCDRLANDILDAYF